MGGAQAGCPGAPDRIRTCDLRLRRPTLYPLSYRRASADDTRRRSLARRSAGERQVGHAARRGGRLDLEVPLQAFEPIPEPLTAAEHDGDHDDVQVVDKP